MATQQIGRYRIDATLGRGGMGEVYDAVLEGPGGFEKRVALKVLRASSAGDDEARRALVREARLGALLRHPNLVDVYELGEAEGRLFIAMEIVDGPTVADLLDKGPLSPRAALEVARQACNGLAHAHELRAKDVPSGLIHRDLKPSNLLLDRSGLVKIADLGIARLAGAAGGKVEGTRGFMSPEQCEGLALDARSDLFSLGLVLWTMLTGSSPVRRGSLMATLLATAKIDAMLHDAALTAPVRAISEDLVEVIRRCLSYRVEGRFTSARQLGKALRRIEREAPGDALLDLLAEREGSDPDTAMWVLPPSPDTVALRAPTPKPVAAVPIDSNRFVGRDEALAEVADAIDQGSIVTIRGPSGVGKSRLAREASRALPRVALADLSSADHRLSLLQAIGRALGHPLGAGDDDTLSEQLAEALRHQRGTWLLLDNADRVMPALRALIPGWVSRGAKFVITAREALELPGERAVALAPLSQEDAMALVSDRLARPLHPDEREPLRALVARLDGLPLALELAATRAAQTSVTEVLDRLDAPTAGGGPDETGDRTMWQAVALSWALLSEPEQRALAQLSLFIDGFPIEAAERVVDLSWLEDPPWTMDVIHALYKRSLLWSRSVEGSARFGLYKTVQRFASAQLPDDDPATLRFIEWHARYGERGWRESLYVAGGPERLDTLHRERANLEAACHAAVRLGLAEEAGRCFLALAEVATLRGPARAALAAATDVIGLRGLRLLRAEVLVATGTLLADAGRHDEAHRRLTEAIRVAQRVDDRVSEGLARVRRAVLPSTSPAEGVAAARRGVAMLQDGSPRLHGVALTHLAIALQRHNQASAARAPLELALAALTHAGDAFNVGLVLDALGEVHRDAGDHVAAEDAHRQALALHRRVGNLRSECVALGHIGRALAARGQLDQAYIALAESRAIARRVGLRAAEAIALGDLGQIMVARGQTDEGRRCLEIALAAHHAMGHTRHEADALLALATLDEAAGDRARAADRFAAAAERYTAAGRLDEQVGAVIAHVRALGAHASRATLDRVRAVRRAAEVAHHHDHIGALLVEEAAILLALGDPRRARIGLDAAEALLGDPITDRHVAARFAATQAALRR